MLKVPLKEVCALRVNTTSKDILAIFDDSDIFSANKTGMFFKCLPDITLTFKVGKCHGAREVEIELPFF